MKYVTLGVVIVFPWHCCPLLTVSSTGKRYTGTGGTHAAKVRHRESNPGWLSGRLIASIYEAAALPPHYAQPIIVHNEFLFFV